MKKIFFTIVLLATAFIQTGFTQENKDSTKVNNLLPLYYSIADALVKGDATLASTNAGQLVQFLNSSTAKRVTGNSHDALLKSAAQISLTKDLKKQRDYFSSLSNTMIALTQSSKLTVKPVYLLYCPMKKSSWLSSEKLVKNPYYGSSMLNCGSVVKTIN